MTITGGRAPFPGTILLIEDDSFVREGLASLLKSEGLDVVLAANANEALALVARKDTHPDFILSDFSLRGSIDGVECIKALRALRASKIPAIVLTGDIRSEQLETIAKDDVGVATKPIDGDVLLKLISHIYAKRAGMERARPRPCTELCKTNSSTRRAFGHQDEVR
jgi:CheY-like chemotaxis protein